MTAAGALVSSFGFATGPRMTEARIESNGSFDRHGADTGRDKGAMRHLALWNA